MIRRAWGRFAHPTGLHPWRWRLLTLWVIAFSLAVSYAVLWGWQAHNDLCATRANALAQIRASEQYLDDVKRGRREPIKGFTTSDITTSIARQTAYAASIHCGPLLPLP